MMPLDDPCHHLAVTYPPPPFTPLVYAQPVALPPGFGALVVSVNRGPYIVPVPTTAKLKVDGLQVPIPGEGTWHIPLPAGSHQVRYTDLIGIPMVTLHPQVIQPGMPHYLTFDFGVWRNRVRDGAGVDVTKFGMWSNYTVVLITFAVVAVLCCGGFAVSGAMSGS
jgi:hypothetical protein